MSARATNAPLIKFVREPVPDSDVMVHCSNGHVAFNLILKIRLSGAMTERVAACVECGESAGID